MKTRRLIAALALALVAATSISSFSSPAVSATSDFSNWQPQFKSEQDLIRSYTDFETSVLRNRYGLPAGFTAQQYGDAVAEERLREIRKQYNLGPHFTSADLAANAGATHVQSLYGHLHLPNNFSADQLRNADFLSRLHWSMLVSKYPKLPFPFSYDDYVRVTGEDDALAYATNNSLPTAWAYDDLVRALGPQSAAGVRFRNGFARNATHAEIERAIGEHNAAVLIHEYGLPAAFTADQLSKLAPPFSQYAPESKLPASFTEADLVAFYGQRTVSRIATEYGLQVQFTEVELRKALAADAIADMARTYDLDPNFTEADVANAYAISYASGLRRQYDLRPDFTAGEYEAAWKNQQKRSASYQMPHYLDYNPY